ncbi:polyprotein [Phytophthora megakarya]|uniref:Polyprotein n=1 Tax=Phytophthora megakarya TaxID=4795 RepID=A0A225WFS6_9STRA|nr:polyprotein [Phytophthora megakarya]
MLTLLKKKDKRSAKNHFDKEQLKKFKELKRRLSDTPVLHRPHFNQPMHLRTDASKFAVGGVLFRVVDGVERRIAYTSGTYQPIFSYLPGAKNGIADALSRISDLQPEVKYFQDLSITSFDDTSFTMEISEVTADSDLIMKIKASCIKDREIQAKFAAIKRRTANLKPKGELQHLKKYRCFTESNGLHWYQNPSNDAPHVVVPNDVKLRYVIISECHDSNYGGHPGAERTYLTLVRRWYYVGFDPEVYC